MPAKGGGVTHGNWFLNLSTFHNTFIRIYSRVTCKVWRYSDALIKLAMFPIYKPLPRGPGSSTSLALDACKSKKVFSRVKILSKSRTLMSQ